LAQASWEALDLVGACHDIAAMQPGVEQVPQVGTPVAVTFQPVPYGVGQAARRSTQAAADREALLHTITRKRLKEGLWSSANRCQRCLMVLGAFFFLISLESLAADECGDYQLELAMKEALAAAQEEPCIRQGAAAWEPSQGAAAWEPGKLLHLYNCSVTGQEHFTPSYPDLQELELFEDNLPSNITGAWFGVEVFYNDRRRSGGWSKTQRVSNVQTKKVVAQGVRIGDHRASSALADVFPGDAVPVKTAANYEYEFHYDPFRVSTPTKLSSKNMRAIAAAYPPVLEATSGDVQVHFSVGNPRSVSVLAAADSTGQLTFWNASTVQTGEHGGVQINRVEKGAVTLEEMLGKVKDAYATDILDLRLGDRRFWHAGWVWFGTWCLLYAKYVCCCCMALAREKKPSEMEQQQEDKVPESHDDECSRCGCSLVWSLLWSLLPTAEVLVLAWWGYRFPFLFLIVGAVFVPCLMCVASGYATRLYKALCVDEKDDGEKNDAEDGLLHGFCNDNIVQIAGILSLSALITTLATTAIIYWVYMPSQRGAHASFEDHLDAPVDPAQKEFYLQLTLAFGIGMTCITLCVLPLVVWTTRAAYDYRHLSREEEE